MNLKQVGKLVEHELRIQRPAASLGMELRGEERLRLMLDTLVRPVIHIDEQRFPTPHPSVSLSTA